MLRLVLPKGSLEQQTLDLFVAADLAVKRNSKVDYRATIDDPRIDEVRILRPQEIAGYIEEGLFDFGITGRDWIDEPSADVVSLGQLKYAKVTSNPIRIVCAVAESSSIARPEDLPKGVRIATEYPNLTARWCASLGLEADVRLSYGATEAKVPEIADAIVELTETGSAIREAGLRIIGTVLESYTELIANRASAADPTKRHAMGQIYTLLSGALDARDQVLVKLNVGERDLESVIAILPSMKSPTVSKLFGNGGYALEAVVNKSEINILIPALKDAGASDILELALSKIVQ